MNSREKTQVIYGITFIAIILVITFICQFCKYEIETSSVYTVYNDSGVRLSECEMKDSLPWEGSYIKNTKEIDKGNYVIEFYRYGCIENCLAYLNDIPVIGILGKGDTENTLRVKIIDTNEYKMVNKGFWVIKDNNDFIIHKQTLEYDAIILVDLKHDNNYTLYIKNDMQEKRRYTFTIDKTSSISNVREYIVGSMMASPSEIPPPGCAAPYAD